MVQIHSPSIDPAHPSRKTLRSKCDGIPVLAYSRFHLASWPALLRLLCCFGFLAGCSPPTLSTVSTLVVASIEPENLNPIFGDIHEGNWKIFDGLVKYDQQLGLLPDLADELPEVSADGKTVTVRLRSGIFFHDGSPLSADDVVFTYRALLDPKTATPLVDQYDSLAEVNAVGPLTVQFILKRVDPAFSEKLWVGIVPKRALAGKDLRTAEFNKAPIGTGPYAFKEWIPGQRLVLIANPKYAGGAPSIPRVVFAFIEDENGIATQLANGSVDIGGLPPKLAERFRNDPRFEVIEVPSADCRVVVLPNGNPILQQAVVRRAFSMAIDRAAMVKGILDGASEPAYGPIDPTQLSFDRSIVPYDPAQARVLLDDAGWKDIRRDGIRYDNAGRRLAFSLMYPADDSLRKEVALAVASDLGKIGVEVDVQGVGWDVIYKRYKIDATLFGWGLPFDPDIELYRLFHSNESPSDDVSDNPAGMKNPEIDRVLDAARGTASKAARTSAYARLQELIREDGSWLYTVRLRHVVVASARIKGISPQYEGHAHGVGRGVLWNLEKWELAGQ